MTKSTELFAAWQAYAQEASATLRAYQAALAAGEGDFDVLRRTMHAANEMSNNALLAFLDSISMNHPE